MGKIGQKITMSTVNGQGNAKSNQISFTNNMNDKACSLMIITLS